MQHPPQVLHLTTKNHNHTKQHSIVTYSIGDANKIIFYKNDKLFFFYSILNSFMI